MALAQFILQKLQDISLYVSFHERSTHICQPGGMDNEFVINRNSASNFPSYDGNDNSQNTELLTRSQSVPSYKISHTASGVVIKVLRYKPAGRGYDSRLCHWNFSVT